MSNQSGSILAPTRPALIGAVVVLFLLGLAIRLYDLTDLPLEFHPTRQLLSEIKARGMYYQSHPELPEWQRKMAIQQWKTRAEVEPEVFERLVAATYAVTGVNTSVARVYASLFWMAGAVFLFLLVRDWISENASLVSTAYFLFFPYAVMASRSFQPDVLMIMLTLAFWWAFSKWVRKDSLAWAIVAGLAGGMAIYVKFVAVFFVVGGALGLGIGALGPKVFKKRNVWITAALGAAPSAAYLYYGIVQQGFLGRQFSGRFIPGLLLSPGNYVQWMSMANVAAGGVAIALGVLGVLLTRDRTYRSFLIGLWSAYVLFGLVFDYHVATHDYYHLPLLAIVAVSLAPAAAAMGQQLAEGATRTGYRLAIAAVYLYCILAGITVAREQFAAVDYRPQARMWSEIGDELGHGPNVVALTQDYGSRLAYWGWQNSIIWPSSGDAVYREARGGSIGFDELFSKMTLGNTRFLVTDFEEYDRQPALQDRLNGYAVVAQGEGYVIFDLERPLG